MFEVFPLILFTALATMQLDSDSLECRIVANPGEFADREVVVRGRLRWTREGLSLAIDGCRDTLTTGTHKWSPEICFRTGAERPPLLSRMGPIVDSVLAELVHKTIDIWVRAEGRLLARPQYTAHPLSNGRFAMNGFCAMNEYSSMLEAGRVLELRMIER